MVNIGFNINAAEVDEQRILDIARLLPSRSHTVMNGTGLARKLYDLIAGRGQQPIIVCRNDWPRDDHWHEFSDPGLYLYAVKRRPDWWSDQYCYYLNEPGIDGDPKQFVDLLKNCIRAMEAAANLHVKAVIGNFADASTFQYPYIKEGLADDFLRSSAQFTHGDYGYIGHHIYTFGTSWTGSAGVPYSQLLNPNPAPPTREQFQTSRENWLQGRFMVNYQRADEIGVARYKAGATEGIFDRMPNGELEGWIPAAEAQWGLPKLFGPLDQRRLLQKLYPGLSGEEAAVRQLEILTDLFAGLPFEFIHLFALNNNSRWSTYNYLLWPEFITKLARIKETSIMPVPPPATLGHGVKATLTSAYTLRTGPGKSYSPIRVVLAGEKVVYYPLADPQYEANDYCWYWTEVTPDAGYMADGGQFQPEPELKLNAPFYTQHGTGYLNNCGPAALSSVLDFEAESPGVKVIAEWMGKGNGYTDVEDMIEAARHWDVRLERSVDSGGTTRQELDRGHPVIALVNRGLLNQGWGDFEGAHFITAVGYGDGFYLIHDPYGQDGQGQFEPIRTVDYEAALIGQRILVYRQNDLASEFMAIMAAQAAKLRLLQVQLQEVITSLESVRETV